MNKRPLVKSAHYMIAALTLLFYLNNSFHGEDKLKEKKKEAEQQWQIHEEIIVTATRTEKSPSMIPQAITILNEEELKKISPLSLLDSLRHKVGIWIEKRTTTTSDPVLRGMSGYRILSLIDGNSLSTLWGEGGAAGDDMYGKIDSDSIERIEVVRGPSSVLYGSNAMAGVINFFTKEPPLDFTSSGFRTGGLFKYVFGSSANENRARGEIYGALPKFRFILGGSFKDIGNAHGGNGSGILSPSGGKGKNLDFKVHFLPASNQLMKLSFQAIDQDDLYRYYRPFEKNYNNRIGISLEYRIINNSPLFREMELKLYYQKKKDKRFWTKPSILGWTAVTTYSIDFQINSILKNKHLLTYGFHYHLDNGECPDDEQFTREYPNGNIIKDAPNSKWRNIALFLQDQFVVSRTIDVTAGFRWDNYNFNSYPDNFYISTFGNSSIDKIKDGKNALTGGFSTFFKISDDLNFYINLSRGFHAPAPMFGVKQLAYGIQVPCGLLKPEKSQNYEIGLKAKRHNFQGNLAFYYTKFRDFVAVVPGRYMGLDWYDMNKNSIRESNENVYIAKNSANAYVFGTEIEGEFLLGNGFSIYSGFSWNYGNDKTSGQPLRHTIPPYGIFSLRWNRPRFNNLWAEFTIEVAARYFRISEDRIKNDPGYRSNPQDMSSPLITSDGHLPGYLLLYLKSGVDLNRNVSIIMALENVTNRKYRKAHSRMDGIGINFQFGISFKI